MCNKSIYFLRLANTANVHRPILSIPRDSHRKDLRYCHMDAIQFAALVCIFRQMLMKEIPQK